MSAARRARRTLLGLLAWVLLVPPARAEQPPDAAFRWPPRQRAARCTGASGEVLARLSLALQLRLVTRGPLGLGRAPRVTLLLASARRLAGAWMDRCPDEPMLPYLRAASRWLDRRRDDPAVRRALEADLRRVRAADPAFQAGRVAFELGIAASLRGDNETAAREFGRSLRHAPAGGVARPPVRTLRQAVAEMLFGPVPRGLARYDLADALVALPRRTEEALEHFRRAVAELRHEERPETVTLARWGEALALHRLDRRQEALEVLRSVQDPASPPGPPATPGVFFSPPSEGTYYEALGWLAAGTDPRRSREARCEALTRARQAFETYGRQVRQEGREPPWTQLAVREQVAARETSKRLGCR